MNQKLKIGNKSRGKNKNKKRERIELGKEMKDRDKTISEVRMTTVKCSKGK